MSIAGKMVDYLRSAEVTEPDLIRIYTNFGKQVYSEGFNEGCEFIRGIFRKQKIHRKQCLRKKYSKFLTELDDYLHAI
jgi:hypothetical protein